jgi:hypothetical protein
VTEGQPQTGEVKAYVKRLLLTITIGLLGMIAAAVWAWQTYGGSLDHAPPLPEGSPPLSSVPLPQGDASR